MAGYTVMTDDELGMDTYIKEDRIGEYIIFKAVGRAEEMLDLDGRLIAF